MLLSYFPFVFFGNIALFLKEEFGPLKNLLLLLFLEQFFPVRVDPH